MILFFGSPTDKVFAVQTQNSLSDHDGLKLSWLFGQVPLLKLNSIDGIFIGPRATMITPWSSNAVDITCNMGIESIIRIEQFIPRQENERFDPMLFQKYPQLTQEIFHIDIKPQKVIAVHNIEAYNNKEGLALNKEEVTYLEEVSQRIGRPLTDSEVFGFSQVNSEHCRHKIFNGTFIIDEEEKLLSLFELIKKTSKAHPNEIVSAYKDNVAFIQGPEVTQFAPKNPFWPESYEKKKFKSVLSLKAETHNFPTTVEPFNGAATGSGGEIRDRMAGGKGSFPLAGTAVYMTAYSRLQDNRPWENGMVERPWLYQTPIDILIKASNGASDFGNKFGQPLIAGSLLTFEHEEHNRKLAYDKVIMLAGGVGYGKADQAQKEKPSKGDRIVVLGGDNYRIGMGGAAVSSADTGEFASGIELNAVQRSNPEMQKRVANVVRGMMEDAKNAIVSIHDHGAGGHLNCLSELVEEMGGKIDLDKLPIGDPTLSAKEIIGNESQERMGLLISPQHFKELEMLAARERAPIYNVGEITGDERFSFVSQKTGETPLDLALSDMFGSSPKTIMTDHNISRQFQPINYEINRINEYLENVLRLESVACKDWLTNKVDRCVGGRVAKQQCAGPLQLPLNNVGVMALDYDSSQGVATSIGHAPVSGLISAAAGARNSVAEALTNIIWAPLKDGLKSVSLSANWMWPCKNPGEDARLYEAVESISNLCIQLGINIPTGKDSLSMKQKYSDDEVIAPGTVIVSAVANCNDINKIIEPVFKVGGGPVYYMNFAQGPYHLGGSAFAQINNKVGETAADIRDPDFLASAFNVVQQLIKQDLIVAGHDISSGGLITTLLEMCFADNHLGAQIDLTSLREEDIIRILFSESCGIVFQAKNDSVEEILNVENLEFFRIGSVEKSDNLSVTNFASEWQFDINKLRDVWYETSWLLDQKQSGEYLALARYKNYKNQPLQFTFPTGFKGKIPSHITGTKIKAAIIRDQGSNSERELAHAMYLAGFEVRDVHMTDLISGRETLEDIRFLGAVGGFSNSDVLGSAKGWAGSFLYNDKAKKALDYFFSREDVLSIGVCNGCQLFMELNLINREHSEKATMGFNDSHKHESAFTSVAIQPNNSVMLSDLAGCNLGVWISHGEGKFQFPLSHDHYHIVAEYGYTEYPSNPNGSDFNTAMLSSHDGRHLVTMPHIERSIFPWNWAYYHPDRNDEISPWIEAFVYARKWLEKN
ncbi:MAG: phosphoribosylformylglycinamidine synthase [Saprospiraceae bacterium]|nr:phosphoribosylformylglycinamidine synthase [Saprospiraceae bacterium]